MCAGVRSPATTVFTFARVQRMKEETIIGHILPRKKSYIQIDLYTSYTVEARAERSYAIVT